MTVDETIQVNNLSVRSKATDSFILKNINFTINNGECIILKGPSGSGKTVLALSIMGLINSGLTVTSGFLSFGGSSYNLAIPQQLASLRGRSIAMAFQLPLESFNPLIKVGKQITDSLRIHRPRLKSGEIKRRVEKALRKLGFSDTQTIFNAYPHQLSGGQLQRCILSSVTLFNTKLLIVDEPTASIDVQNAELLINLLCKLNTEYGVSIILITHEESIISKFKAKTLYLHKGELGIEPRHKKKIMSNLPFLSTVPETEILLTVKGLSKSFKIMRGDRTLNRRKKIFEGISFDLKKGEVLGIVGPSGSGKTTLAKCLVGLVQPETGTITIDGRVLLKRQPLQIASTLGIYYLWQNPVNCLDPRMTVQSLLIQPISRLQSRHEAEKSVTKIIQSVGLSESILTQKPSEISGGQAQRVVIARLLLMEVKVLIADEPVSYLDYENKSLAFQLFLKLVKETGLSIILISHDTEIISICCNRILTLINGGIYGN